MKNAPKIKQIVKTVLARLRENRYLDDARYALEFARHRAKYRRQGRFRIARELRARGVADAHIEAALDAVFRRNATKPHSSARASNANSRRSADRSINAKPPRSTAGLYAPDFQEM